MATAIANLQNSARKAWEQSAERQIRNVIDPFQSLVVSSTFGLSDIGQFQNVQNANSALRGLSNAIGRFHQDVLASVDGWDDHDAGYDLECAERRIIAEVKNKHNTLNDNDRRGVINNLEAALRNRQGHWVAYLVEVIPKRPERYKTEIRNRIWKIDGASFYHLATGEENALRQLFDALCERLNTTPELLGHCKHLFESSIHQMQ